MVFFVLVGSGHCEVSVTVLFWTKALLSGLSMFACEVFERSFRLGRMMMNGWMGEGVVFFCGFLNDMPNCLSLMQHGLGCRRVSLYS